MGIGIDQNLKKTVLEKILCIFKKNAKKFKNPSVIEAKSHEDSVHSVTSMKNCFWKI